MGTYKQGILGGFSGKVGAVVGSYWKGRNVMRGLNRSYSDAKSDLQLTQRMRFSLANAFLLPILSVVKIGYQAWSKTIGERDAAMHQIMVNATTGSYPTVSLDYSKIKLAEGILTPGSSIVVSQNNGKVNFDWEDNSQEGNASEDDTCLIVVYNTDQHEALSSIPGTQRNSCNYSFEIPTNWLGQTAECYFGFVSQDGRTVSNCVYVTDLVIA